VSNQHLINLGQQISSPGISARSYAELAVSSPAVASSHYAYHCILDHIKLKLKNQNGIKFYLYNAAAAKWLQGADHRYHHWL